MLRIRQQRLKSEIDGGVSCEGGRRSRGCGTAVDSYKNRNGGFTVTELMVAVSLMSLIVFALYSMFNQTQKAMRANEAQVDSSERGRGVLELVSREIESARVGGEKLVTNLWVTITPGAKKVQGDLPNSSLTVVPRTNVFDNIFYLTKSSKAWRGVAYSVLDVQNATGSNELVRPTQGGLGTLVRYETPLNRYEYGHPTTNLFKYFLAANPNTSAAFASATNYSQIADGVVHFRLTPYDSQGRIMAFNSTNLDPNYRILRTLADGTRMGTGVTAGVTNANQATVILQQSILGDNTETTAIFRSNALPAYVELELGILEPETMRQYKQMVTDGMQARADQFLAKRIGKVQIYRKRIPLRTVAQ